MNWSLDRSGKFDSEAVEGADSSVRGGEGDFAEAGRETRDIEENFGLPLQNYRGLIVPLSNF